MNSTPRRTKIVATLGPASSSPEVIRKLILAGMDVARLNFSHGSYEAHEKTIVNLRAIALELDRPVTILQDLQGPKVRVGNLPGEEIELVAGEVVTLVPEAEYVGAPQSIPLDYPYAAEEALPGMQVLLADGLFELKIEEVVGTALRCKVLEGGTLKSRKGVNFPNLKMRLPSLTDKDREDVLFGLSHDVDWISLSFVRSAADVRVLREMLVENGANKPIIAKIEKPQAVEQLEEILREVDGIMVARGDLGVEMSPEKVPMLQKRIIESCNRAGKPVITATQMLESMIKDPRPTRAEASDVANAIIDGTDAVMLSGESAVGAFPVRAVEMMAKIAREVEAGIVFKTFPASGHSDSHAISRAANTIAEMVSARCIAVMTTTGHTAHQVAAERPKTPVIAITTAPYAYHALNLIWGIKPLLVTVTPSSFDDLVSQAESVLLSRQLCAIGDRILVIGGVPVGLPRGSNFVKIHTVGSGQ